MAKFWVLYLSLAGVKQLENGMSDIAGYVEDCDENRKILASFLPKPKVETKEVVMCNEDVQESQSEGKLSQTIANVSILQVAQIKDSLNPQLNEF